MAVEVVLEVRLVRELVAGPVLPWIGVAAWLHSEPVAGVELVEVMLRVASVRDIGSRCGAALRCGDRRAAQGHGDRRQLVSRAA